MLDLGPSPIVNRTSSDHVPQVPAPDDMHVLVPAAVDIPRPKNTAEQICVPSSINGRDLTAGRP